ncbi:hypothetical protein M0802_002304 [Mischocyttarus mexicanus]|nr:hypothetical protein M0802_002304 [Mischocyttarus mexicanus]
MSGLEDEEKEMEVGGSVGLLSKGTRYRMILANPHEPKTIDRNHDHKFENVLGVRLHAVSLLSSPPLLTRNHH